MPLGVAARDWTARRPRAVQVARRLVTVLLGAAAVLLLGNVAVAFWTSGGTGTGVAATASLTAPTKVSASAPVNSDAVAVSWEGSTLTTGDPAAGYYVTRTSGTGGNATPACATSPSAPTSELACDDLGVSDGSYRYVVTAVHASWTAQSQSSAVVTVLHDYDPPVVQASTSPVPNAKGYNKTSMVTVNLSTTDVAGVESITYTVDSGSPVTVAASSASVPVAGDGVHTVTFTAIDVVGNESAVGSTTVRIDTVAPDAPAAPVLVAESDSGVSSGDRITNDRTPTFTGTAEAGTTVTLYSGTSAVGSAVAALDGTYTVTAITELSSGTRTMTTRATDVADNSGPASPATSVTIDYTAPSSPDAPSLTSASDSGRWSSDRVTNDTTPTFTGDGTSGTVSVRLYDGGVEVGGSTASSSSYTVTSGVLVDGTHSMTSRVSDVAGNLSSASSSRSVTIDTVAPVAPSAPSLHADSDTGASSTDRITSDTTPRVIGSSEDSAVVTLYAGAGQVGTDTTSSTAYSVTSEVLAEGAHTLSATATDVAGNLGPASAGTTITVDTTAPTAPSAPVLVAESDSGVSSGDRITNDRTPTFTGTAAEIGTDVRLFDGDTATGMPVTAPRDGSYTATTDTLSSGTRTITARTDPDLAGNVGISPATSVTIDYTAPSSPDAPSLTSASDSGRWSSDRVTNDTTPTFTGDGTSGTVSVRLYDGGVEVGGSTASSSSYTVTSGVLVDGTHSMTSRVSDVAGNLSSASSSRSVTIDTVAPVAPSAPSLHADSDTGASSTDRITSDTTPRVIGSSEDSAVVTLYAGAGQVGTDTTSSTAYSVTSEVLAEGAHTLSATATDVAGNLGPASAGTTITVDTTAPTAPSAPVLVAESDSGVSSGDRITNDRTPTFTGTAAEIGTDVRLFDGDTATGMPVTAPRDGSYTATTDTLSSGTRTITARTDPDLAGNVGISPATSVTIDYTAPSVDIDVDSWSAVRFDFVFSQVVHGFTSSDVVLSGTARPTTSYVTGTGTRYEVAVSGMDRDGTVSVDLGAGQVEDTAGNPNLASSSGDNTINYDDDTAPAVSITSFAAAADQSAAVSGTAGVGPGDNATVTVVLCLTSSWTCSAENTRASLTATVDPVTGAWSVTSGNLGTTAALYARAIAADLSGNQRQTGAEGPIVIR